MKLECLKYIIAENMTGYVWWDAWIFQKRYLLPIVRFETSQEIHEERFVFYTAFVLQPLS